MDSRKYNYFKLSKYFLDKSQRNEVIPFMTAISKETGISNSTISRYARKKGYYNFGELRAVFNKELGKNFTVVKYEEFAQIFQYEKIRIATSISTKIIGMFLVDRMMKLNINIDNYDEKEELDKKTLLIFISLSLESTKIKEIMNRSISNKLIITASKKQDYKADIKQICLPQFKPDTRNNYDIYNSSVKMINWLNDVINANEIKKENMKMKNK